MENLSDEQYRMLEEIFKEEPIITDAKLSIIGSFRMTPTLFDKIEVRRGRTPRSKYVSDLIEKALEAV